MFKTDKSMLLKLSGRSADSEFQIVTAAWQNEQLPKTFFAPAS